MSLWAHRISQDQLTCFFYQFHDDIFPGFKPARVLAYLKSGLPNKTSFTFKSFSEAHESLQDIYLEHFEIVTMSIAEHAAYASKLREWEQGFKDLIASRRHSSTFRTEDRRTIALLEFRRQDIDLNIRAVTPGTGHYGRNRLKWDKYTDQFSDMVDNAAIAMGLEDNDNSRKEPQFYLHFGHTVILGSLIARCRDPYIRRKALALMAAQPVQEGIFNSEFDVKITRRQLELEEGERAVKSCHDIPEDARVATSGFRIESEDTIVVEFNTTHRTWEETF